jgi:pyridoxine kinase
MRVPRRKPTVLVISSHVARGAVGNRAAVFALERLGFPVVAVPTVTLPWHPGEGRATRIIPPDEAFAKLLGDLAEAPWLGEVGGILSGYLGAAGQAAPIAALVEAVKARNPAALYLCDPVIGDEAGPYVPEPVIAAIREKLIPLADMATPNRHELGFIGGGVPTGNDDLIAASRTTGVPETVVTSAFGKPNQAANLLVAPEGAHLATHTALAAAPHGTGDLLAALYLAHRLDGIAAPEALRLAAGATYRLAELAAGDSALPLAAGQEALVSSNDAVTLERLG